MKQYKISEDGGQTTQNMVWKVPSEILSLPSMCERHFGMFLFQDIENVHKDLKKKTLIGFPFYKPKLKCSHKTFKMQQHSSLSLIRNTEQNN